MDTAKLYFYNLKPNIIKVSNLKISIILIGILFLNACNKQAMLVRKYQTEYSMEVRVLTEKLGDFLQYMNDEKLFLKARNIYAEDVTANIQLAKLESSRMQKNGQKIGKLHTTAKK